jgi:hypothetical protein
MDEHETDLKKYTEDLFLVLPMVHPPSFHCLLVQSLSVHFPTTKRFLQPINLHKREFFFIDFTHKWSDFT